MVEPATEINGADLVNLHITDDETADHSKQPTTTIFIL